MKLTKLRQAVQSCTRLSLEEKESIFLDIELIENNSIELGNYPLPISCFYTKEAFENTCIPRGYWYLLDDLLTNDEYLPELIESHTI